MTIGPKRAPAMHWLMTLAHLAPAHVSPWFALRAAIAIGVPAAVGLYLNESHIAALVSIGALPAITGDKGGPYHERAMSIGCTVAGGVLGYYLGVLLHGDGWLTLLGLLTLVLGASLIGTLNSVAAVATLKLSVYAIVGANLDIPMPPLERAELVGMGGLFGLALTLSGWLFNARAPERATLASVLRKLAALLAAAPASRSASARREMESAVSNAYDTLWAERRRHGASHQLAQLAVELQACAPVVHASLALVHSGQLVPAAAIEKINAIAGQIARGQAIDFPTTITQFRTLNCGSLADAFQEMQAILQAAPSEAVARLGPAPVPHSWRSYLKKLNPSANVRRYLFRLGLCLVVAELVPMLFSLTRSYWVPLIVVVMFKSNFGSFFGRAFQSFLGSMVGVGISVLVLAVDRDGVVSVCAIFILASLLPWAIKRNYGLFTAIWLPILMLLIGGLQKTTSWPIAQARFIDVCIATVIVLLVGYLPWMRVERDNLDRTLSGTIDAIANYLEQVYMVDDATRHRLHSVVYAKLGNLRAVLDRAAPEPPLVRQRAMAWWPVEAALEIIANRISDIGWKRAEHAPEPAPDDIAPLVQALRQMSRHVKDGDSPPDCAVSTTSVPLSSIAQSIETLRTTLTGPMTIHSGGT